MLSIFLDTNIGIEQWFLALLGTSIHILVRWNKARIQKKNSFSLQFWVKENGISTVISILSLVAIMIVAKDFLNFGELPLMWRNLLCFSAGYNTDSVFKNMLVNKGKQFAKENKEEEI